MIRYALLAAGSGAWILDATMDLISTGKRVVRTEKGDLLLKANYYNGMYIRYTIRSELCYSSNCN